MAKVKLSAAFAFLKLKIPSIAELNENDLEPSVILKRIEENRLSGAFNPDILIEQEVIEEWDTVRICEDEFKSPCPGCGITQPPIGLPPTG